MHPAILIKQDLQQEVNRVRATRRRTDREIYRSLLQRGFSRSLLRNVFGKKPLRVLKKSIV